MSGQALN